MKLICIRFDNIRDKASLKVSEAVAVAVVSVSEFWPHASCSIYKVYRRHSCPMRHMAEGERRRTSSSNWVAHFFACLCLRLQLRLRARLRDFDFDFALATIFGAMTWLNSEEQKQQEEQQDIAKLILPKYSIRYCTKRRRAWKRCFLSLRCSCLGFCGT